ncbi:MAG: glycosyltransferase [Elusimicrobia bacterium]|nr:glycosyltransferase [Elusimicrobiota bacterium]
MIPHGNARVIRTRCDVRLPSTNFMKRFIMNRTHRILVPARFIKRGYEKIYPEFSKRRITLIPQGIDTDEFPAQPEPSYGNGMRIGILGRLDPVKGHRFLIEAFASVHAEFPQSRLCIAGREEHVSVKTLAGIAESWGISSNVEFLGHIEEPRAFIANCHIGVIASISSEAVSRAALEWMASQRALIATRVGGIPDLVSHEINGLLVEPAQPAALAAAIKRLIKDQDMRSRVARYARKSIETTFSMKNFVNMNEVVYKDAIDNPAC